MSTLLGISAFYHDSAAVLIVDGKIVFAVQEERLSRKKHDASFPVNAVKACLSCAGKPLTIDELDAIVFYDKPFLKFERLLETYYSFAPRGIRQFLSAMPVWLKEKLFLKKIILDNLKSIGDFDKKKLKLLFSEHHLSHAASAFYPSPYNEAAIVTIDGVGEWATASIAHGTGSRIKIIKELKFPHSLGLLYSAFTYYAGFKVNSGEYKLMGLAPYGNPGSDRVKKMEELILSRIVEIKDDGSLRLYCGDFDFIVGMRMVNEKKWEQLFGFPPRKPESEITQEHCDLALAIQSVTENVVLKMAREAKRITGCDNLCLAGGVALNCVANGRLLDENIFKNVWIQPAAGDAGGALGAALSVYHMYYECPRNPDGATDSMQGSYLGNEYGGLDIELMAKSAGAVYEKCEWGELYDKVAGLLENGMVVGWHQGRMEWGPRSLGNRSILGDARNPDMQKKLNLKIKYRESFRPFAPSVLCEDVKQYFQNGYHSPYMLIIDYVKNSRRRALPEGYHGMPLKEKLYHLRSDIPAITHLDFSARVQTVHPDTNPKYHRLIEAFKKRTGFGVIVNTSFNVRGEPIVCAPEDSYKCFMRTEMDCLVIENYIFEKPKQPPPQEDHRWKEEDTLD